MKMRKMLLSIALFTALFSLLSLLLFWLKPGWQAPYWLLVQLFLALSTGITIVLSLAHGKTPATFVNRYILLMIVKLLLSLCILVLFALSSKNAVVPFFIYFLSSYLGYLAFETLYLYSAMRRKS